MLPCTGCTVLTRTNQVLVLLTLICFVIFHLLASQKLPELVMSFAPAVNYSLSGWRNMMTHAENETVVTATKLACQQNMNHSGRLPVNVSTDTFEAIARLFKPTVSHGGKYEPNNCTSTQRVAVIIPYRDREEHLKIFLRHMHPFLQRQQLSYSIFVVEMDKHVKFNRAMLMNIGFVEAMKLANYTCFVFHDVDLIPEDNRIPYYCAGKPQHLSVAVDTLNYRLPYSGIFGGASSIRTEQFRMINGFSNMFFGWGGEDDDIFKRIQQSNLSIVRPSITIARYKMIKHTKDGNKNPERFCLLKSTKERMYADGLSNLMYTVKAFEFRPLYTWVLVTVNETEQERSKFFEQCSENKQKKMPGDSEIKRENKIVFQKPKQVT